MSAVGKKTWRDLMGNKVRTTLVVLSIAVGVFALGLVFNMRDALHGWMLEDYRSANASHLLVRMVPFDHDLVKSFQREFAGVAVESQVSLSMQWRMAGETLWRDATLVAKPDYAAQRLDRIELQSGLSIGRFDLQWAGAVAGDSNRGNCRLPDRQPRGEPHQYSCRRVSSDAVCH